MKNLLLLILGLSFAFSFGQKHEIGLFLGGSNVIGDVGKDSYINPMPIMADSEYSLDRIPFAIGGIYRFNINPHMGFRLNAMFGKVVGMDKQAKERYKKDRNYAYRNNIIEGSLVFEYNFFDINDEYGKKHTPYIFGGVGAFMYDESKYTVNHTFARDEEGVIFDPPEIETEIISKAVKQTSFSLPFGVGYKVRIKHNFVLSAEVGFRYTKTDNLDLSFAKEGDFTFNSEPGLDPDMVDLLNANIIKSRQIGNMSTYDWYVFTGITLTYSFGRLPCYCD